MQQLHLNLSAKYAMIAKIISLVSMINLVKVEDF